MSGITRISEIPSISWKIIISEIPITLGIASIFGRVLRIPSLLRILLKLLKHFQDLKLLEL